jgi:hypothetical protein
LAKVVGIWPFVLDSDNPGQLIGSQPSWPAGWDLLFWEYLDHNSRIRQDPNQTFRDSARMDGSQPKFGTVLQESSDGSRMSLDSGIIFQIPASTDAGIWLVEIQR